MHNAAVEQWRESGRQGEPQIRGAQASKINGKKATRDALAAAQTKCDEEYKVARSQLEGELKKRTSSVEILTRRIAEIEALINGNDSQPDLRGSTQ